MMSALSHSQKESAIKRRRIIGSVIIHHCSPAACYHTNITRATVRSVFRRSCLIERKRLRYSAAAQ